MNIAPFYELRTRLYSSAASGCGTVNEDFRLKRAVEAFEPLAQANKAFMKLYSDCGRLFTSNEPASVLSDCIALADALAVTQGSFSDSSETKQSDINANTEIIPAAYSDVYELCGKIERCSSKLEELSDKEISLISDGRVLSAFIKAAESGNVYLDEFAENVISICGNAIVPMLKNTVDLTDAKCSGKKVEYICKAAHEQENDYYIWLAKNTDAPQNIRIAAIKAMENSPENAPILLELYNTEKGKVKNAALTAVLKLDPPEAGEILTKLIEKSKGSYEKYADLVRISPSQTAVGFVRAQIAETSQAIRSKNISKTVVAIENTAELFRNKTDIADCFIEAAELSRLWGGGCSYVTTVLLRLNNVLINNLNNKDNEKYRCLITELFEKSPDDFLPAYFLMRFTEAPEETVEKLSDKLKKYHLFISDLLGNMRYSTVQKAYYSRYYYLGHPNNDESAGKVFLFYSIPDSVLAYMCSLTDISENDYEKLCYSLGVFIGHCAPHDRERVIAAVLETLFEIAKKSPSYRCIGMIAEYCPQSMAYRCKGIVSDYIYNTLITRQAAAHCSIIDRLPLSHTDKIDELTGLLNRVAAAKGDFSENTRSALIKTIKSTIDLLTKG